MALQWFKTQMNLVPVLGHAPREHTLLGLSIFHFFVMLALMAFLVVMVWMYFFKMRRAAALLRNLAGPLATGSATPPVASRSPAGAAPSQAPEAAAVLPPLPTRAQNTVSQVAAAAGARASALWTGPLRVARIFEETKDVKTFRLANPGGGDLSFSFEPGQFITVAVTIAGKLMRRSYSIASSPCCRGWCEITVKRAPNGWSPVTYTSRCGNRTYSTWRPLLVASPSAA